MIRALLIKECKLVLRDKQALAALFIMPAVFILIMSLALKDTFNDKRALLSYQVIDREKSAFSAELVAWLGQNPALKAVAPVTASTAESVGKRPDLRLTIPSGFSAGLKKDPIPIKARLALQVDAGLTAETVQLVQSWLMSELARLKLTGIRLEFSPFIADEDLKAFDAGLAAFNAGAENLICLSYAGQPPGRRPSSTQQSVPSWIVFGMFFVMIPISTIFINERRQDTLMRMQAMQVSTTALFLGKVLPYLLINLMQMGLMIMVGVFIVPRFGAAPLTMGKSWTGLLLLGSALSLTAIGSAVLIAVTAQSVEQATTIGGIINILLGAVGVVMVPKFYMPEIMQKLAAFSPMAWGVDGFLDIFLREQGVGGVLPEFVKLTTLGLGLLLLAGFIFSRKARA